eukprot:2489421-Amphidinium_carterae.1
MDANAHLGFPQHGEDNGVAVGSAQPDVENANGTLLRQFMQMQHLAAINTYFGCGSTFYSGQGHRATRVDYILCPAAALPRVQRCEMWHRAGDRLQLIQVNARRDHRPLAVRVALELTYTHERGHCRKHWDHDGLLRCWQYGEHREAIISDVEARLCERDFDVLSRGASPDALYTALQECVYTSFAKHYYVRANTRPVSAELEEAREVRAQCRAQLQLYAGLPDTEPIVVRALDKAREATRQARAIARRDRQEFTDMCVQQLEDAIKDGELRRAWRLTRLLSGKALGPKKRNTRAALSVSYSRHEWHALLGKRGCDGGLSGQPVEWSTWVQHTTLSLPPCPAPTLSAHAEALQSLRK